MLAPARRIARSGGGAAGPPACAGRGPRADGQRHRIQRFGQAGAAAGERAGAMDLAEALALGQPRLHPASLTRAHRWALLGRPIATREGRRHPGVARYLSQKGGGRTVA